MISIQKQKQDKNTSIYFKLEELIINQISNFSTLTSNLFISGYIYTIICFCITYLKFIGIILYKLTFRGLTQGISNNLFKIINLTNFLLDKGILSELLVILLFIKNLFFIIVTLFIICVYLNTFLRNKSFNNSIDFKDSNNNNHNNIKKNIINNRLISISYQFLFSFTFWISLAFEFELGIFSIFSDRYSNYTYIEYIYIVLNYVNLISSVLISFAYAFYFNKIELDNDCGDFLTRLDSNNELILLFLKLVYSIVYAINLVKDKDIIQLNYLLIILFTCHISYFAYFISFSIYFNKTTQILSYYLNSCCIFSILVGFLVYNVNNIYDPDLIIFSGFFIFYLISYFAYYKIVNNYLKYLCVEFTSTSGLNNHMFYLIKVATIMKHDELLRLTFYGALRNHEVTCIYKECACKLKENSVLYIPKNKTKLILVNNPKNKSEEREFNLIYIYHCIKSIFEYYLKVAKTNNTNLYILYCYFMYYYIGNYFFSMYFILYIKTFNKNLTIQQIVSLERILQLNNITLEQNMDKLDNDNEFSYSKEQSENINNNNSINKEIYDKNNYSNIYNQNHNLKKVHNELFSQDNINIDNINIENSKAKAAANLKLNNKNTSDIKDSKIDFAEILTFYNCINELKSNINNSLDLAFQFWNSVILKIDLQKIKKYGLKFSKYNVLVDRYYKNILNIHSNNSEVNNLYYMYQLCVFGKTNSSLEIKKGIEKLINNNDNLCNDIEISKKQKSKYFSKNSTLVIANITDNSKAIIEKISENVTYYLGLNPSECLGQDVKILMPYYFKIRHSKFLDTHFKTGINKILNNERDVYALHSLGYSIKSKIIVKLANCINSINYLGFIRSIKTNYEYIVLSKQGEIILYSKGLYEKLFKDYKIINSNYFYIHFFCKEYLDEIHQIYESYYEINDLSQDNYLSDKHGYFILNFGINKTINNLIKSDKKQTKSYNFNNDYMSDNGDNKETEERLPNLLLKLNNKKADIKDEFHDELKTKNMFFYIAKKEYTSLSNNETVVIIKLYNKIDDNSSINKQELIDLQKYLLSKNLSLINKANQKCLSINKLYNKKSNQMLTTNNINNNLNESNVLKELNNNNDLDYFNNNKINLKSKNKDINLMNFDENTKYIRNNNKDNSNFIENYINNYFDCKALEKTINIRSNENNKDNIVANINISSVDGSANRSILNNDNNSINYSLLKKKFLDKEDNYKTIYLTLILNLTAFTIVIILISLNYSKFYEPKKFVLSGINNKYINILDILIIINSLKHSLNIFSFDNNNDDYLSIYKGFNIYSIDFNQTSIIQAETEILSDYNSLKAIINFINIYDNKENHMFLSFLSEEIEYNKTSSSKSILIKKITIKQYIETLYSKLHRIINFLSIIKTSYNSDIINLKEVSNKFNFADKNNINLRSKFLDQKQMLFELSKNYIEFKVLLSNEKITNIKNSIVKNIDEVISSQLNNSKYKNINFYVIISLLCVLSLLSFIKIVYFYFKQNKMISLLFSLNDGIAKEILFSIRDLKGKIFQNNQDNQANINANDDSNLDCMSSKSKKSSEDNYNSDNANKKNNNESVKADNNDNTNEENNLLKKSNKMLEKDKKTSKNKIKSKSKNNINKIEINEKLAKKNKLIVWQVNWSIYIQSFILLAVLTIVCLIPTIYFIDDYSYEEYHLSLIKLIKYYKVNHYLIMLMYTNLERGLVYVNFSNPYFIKKDYNNTLDIEDNIQNSSINYNRIYNYTNDEFDTYKNKLYDIKNNHIALMTESKELNKEGVKLVFKIIKDSSIQSDFIRFFTEDICKNINEFLNCESYTSMFSNKSYEYIENIFPTLIHSIIEKFITISNNIDNPNKINVIRSIYSSEDYMYVHSLFDFYYFYASKMYDRYYLTLVQTYSNNFSMFYKSIFYSTIILIMLYVVLNTYIIKLFNYSVNVEIKQLFSLIPQIVVLNNKGIFELFSSN